jgi:Transcriptional regulator, contains sigma factor-related N-terminal domain
MSQGTIQMPSFRISITPSRRIATRFIDKVRRALQRAYAEEESARGLTQSEIAKNIGVHRSIINRELRGQKDMTLGRVAELAYAMGREPIFELRYPVVAPGANVSTGYSAAFDTEVVTAANSWLGSVRQNRPTIAVKTSAG